MIQDGNSDGGTDKARIPDFVSYLPERVWYLTANGQDMWCRRPYGFFFTSDDAAQTFAATVGSEFALSPIGVASKDLVSSESIGAFRDMELTRLFIDPRIDGATGDVFGTILHITARD